MRVVASFPAPASSLRVDVETGSGFKVTVDSADAAAPAGASPREAVLVGLVGCTGMDVAAILAKKRQAPSACPVSAMLSRSVTLEHRYRLQQVGRPDREARVVITGPDRSNG